MSTSQIQLSNWDSLDSDHSLGPDCIGRPWTEQSSVLSQPANWASKQKRWAGPRERGTEPSESLKIDSDQSPFKFRNKRIIFFKFQYGFDSRIAWYQKSPRKFAVKKGYGAIENYLNNPNIAEEELKNMDEKEVHPSSSNDNIMARDYYSILGVQRQLEKSWNLKWRESIKN